MFLRRLMIPWNVDLTFSFINKVLPSLTSKCLRNQKVVATALTAHKACIHCILSLPLVKKAETLQVQFTSEGEGLKAQKIIMHKKSTWQTMNNVSLFTGVCSNPTSKRWAWHKFQHTMLVVQPLDENQGPHNCTAKALRSCVKWPLVVFLHLELRNSTPSWTNWWKLSNDNSFLYILKCSKSLITFCCSILL